MTTSRALTPLLALALLALLFLSLTTATARAADPVVVRVKVNGATSGTCGTSWDTACGLQYGLTTVAISGTELWVAAGTYTPTTGTDRTATFQLCDGITLYGGFAGGETLRSQRNFTANVTILSGDIGMPGDKSDNAFHVVTGSGVTTTAMLDGFTVRDGNANGPYPDNEGGGIYNYGGGPTLTNITFTSNSAGYGGGMGNFGSSPTLTNITFTSNSADYGGGMDNLGSSSPTLTDSTFNGNVANWGGGMNNSGSSPVLTNITFTGNSATGVGGGMNILAGSSPSLTNVTFISNSANGGGGIAVGNSYVTLRSVSFTSNSADYEGGGIASYDSSPALTNVTFSGNSANIGGAMFINNQVSYYNVNRTLTNVTFSGNSAKSGGALYNVRSSPTIRDAIFWGNTAPAGSQILNYDTSNPKISDSVVQGGCPSGGTCSHIITTDPRLGPPGNHGGSTETIPLLLGSSAIDRGNDATCASTDQRGIPRPQGAHCDMGAYEAIFDRISLPLVIR